MTSPREFALNEPTARLRSMLGSGRRRVVLILCGLLVLCVISVYLTARRGGDESAIGLLPDDAGVVEAWPGATRLGRKPDEVSRMYERDSMILSVRLADRSELVVTASDYAGPARAWLASKIFSPGWNGVYWDYPQRHPADGLASAATPPASRLVGFECPDDSGGPLECNRWVLWWKRGRGIWVVHWSSRKWATTTEALTVMSPLWRG